MCFAGQHYVSSAVFNIRVEHVMIRLDSPAPLTSSNIDGKGVMLVIIFVSMIGIKPHTSGI